MNLIPRCRSRLKSSSPKAKVLLDSLKEMRVTLPKPTATPCPATQLRTEAMYLLPTRTVQLLPYLQTQVQTEHPTRGKSPTRPPAISQSIRSSNRTATRRTSTTRMNSINRKAPIHQHRALQSTLLCLELARSSLVQKQNNSLTSTHKTVPTSKNRKRMNTRRTKTRRT